MTALRVAVFDEATSVRSLLRREIGSAPSLDCADAFPTSKLLENSLDLGGVDALVIGLGHNDRWKYSEIAAKLHLMRLPSIVLSSTKELDTGRGRPSQRQIILEKPRDSQGWAVMCSVLVLVLTELERLSTTANILQTSPSQPGDEMSSIDLIAVGGSAGGPEATGKMLSVIGQTLASAAVLVVQHLGSSFEFDYVEWLGGLLPGVDVGIAEDGEAVQPGRVRIAGPDSHLEVGEGLILRLDRRIPPEHGHRPSVDRLFNSLARRKPENSAGVLLSGMGLDGVEGLLSLREAGCLTMVQSSSSSMVFGMPGAALERGAADISHSPEGLGAVLKTIIEIGKRK